jgi:hypothetical protein
MKTNLTAAQIRAREHVYKAYSREQGVALLPEDVRQLWESIIRTGVELMDLRDKLKAIEDIAKGANHESV